MKSIRIARVAIVGLVGCALLASAVLAGPVATYVPPRDAEDYWDAKMVRLVADKKHGFAPMTVSLTGMMEGNEGALRPLEARQRIRLVVESPFFLVQNGDSVSNLYADMHYEAESTGPVRPSAFHRMIELKRPGTYTFRIQVTGEDGTVLSSNEVSVKAL